MAETEPIELPSPDSEESVFADKSSEEIVAHLARLALMSRHFRIVGRDDYVRDLQVDIDLNEKVLRIRGDEGLLEAAEEQKQPTPPVKGTKTVFRTL